MGKALSICIREQIKNLRQSGQTLVRISSDLQVPYGTVKKLNKQFQERGIISPQYAKCGNKGVIRCSYFYYRASMWLKRRHADWGAPFILFQLQERYGSQGLPSIRQMQTWFKAQSLIKPRNRKGESEAKGAQAVHESWQVDAKEQLRLSDGQVCTYLSVVDEYSGSSLGATLFPPQVY